MALIIYNDASNVLFSLASRADSIPRPHRHDNNASKRLKRGSTYNLYKTYLGLTSVTINYSPLGSMVLLHPGVPLKTKVFTHQPIESFHLGQRIELLVAGVTCI
jgi:hypothetical protein